MLIAPALKKAAVFLVKAFVIYLALIVLWIDMVLFEAAIPGYIFKQQPYIQSAALALTISAAISVAIRSKTPIIFTAICLAYSAFYFVFPHQVTSFIAFFCVVAAISFIYSNKITEPLLAVLLVIAGAWVFICFVYPPYLVAWANYITGRKDLGSSIFECVGTVKDQFIPTLTMLPVVVMYFLGKRSYVKLYTILKSLRK